MDVFTFLTSPGFFLLIQRHTQGPFLTVSAPRIVRSTIFALTFVCLSSASSLVTGSGTSNRGCIVTDHAGGHDRVISLLELEDSYTCTGLSSASFFVLLGPSRPCHFGTVSVFVFRDRSRRTIMGSRLSIWVCESRATGRCLSDFRLSDDPPSCRMVLAFTSTVFSEISGFGSAWFSYCLPVLSGPSDLTVCCPDRLLRGWLSAHDR